MRKLALFVAIALLACSKEPREELQSEETSQISTCSPIPLGAPGPANVSWQAIKNQSVPVDGKISGEGKLVLNGERLLGSKLSMLFDPASLDSLEPLRDSRIREIFLEIGMYPLISYQGQIQFIEGGNDRLPLEGESSAVKVIGPLSMAGQLVTTEIHGNLKRLNGVLLLEKSEKPSRVDLMSSVGLEANSDDLIAAAGVESMERFVEFTGGDVILERICP